MPVILSRHVLDRPRCPFLTAGSPYVLLGKDETGALVVDSVLSLLQCYGNVDSRGDIGPFKTLLLIPTILFQNKWGRIPRGTR